MLTRSHEDRAPYPGLRSFRPDEVDIFFGRDGHVDDMIEKLARSHFLCVTGSSGCGKSSLSRTGLMNGLQAGFLPGRGSDWIFVDFRPGGDPLRILVDSFADAIATELDGAENLNGQTTDLTRKTEIGRLLTNHIALRSRNLNEAISIIEGIGSRPILILIDQFEELFRYAQKDGQSAMTFVDVLLRTVAAKGNIYVVITIRTDELERCSRYPGLTGAINDSQFLTPTLDRFEIQEAIEGPIAVFGGRIDPDFTIWLLNGTEDEPDKLPLLQHVLKLLYRCKLAEVHTSIGNTAEAGSCAAVDSSIVVALSDFYELFSAGIDANAADGDSRACLRNSLSNRLNKIYDALPSRLSNGAKGIFCALTDTETGRRDIRRPRTIDVLASTVGLSTTETREIVSAFAGQDEAYLSVTENENPDNSIVDVTHECVLRLWDRLQLEWLPAEATSADNLRFLATFARNYRETTEGKSFLVRFKADNILRGSNLTWYQKWFEEARPTATWAARYLKWPDDSPAAENPARKSSSAFDWIEKLFAASKTRQQFDKWVNTPVVVIVLLAAFAIYALLTIRNQDHQLAELNDLYKAESPTDADCKNSQGYCGRIQSHIKQKWNLKEFSIASVAPICPPAGLRQMLNDVADIRKTNCGSYPEIGDGIKLTANINNPTDAALVQGGINLVNEGTYRNARAVLHTLAKTYPNNPGIFRNLGFAYQNDLKIADSRRFSEAGACFMRALDLSCRVEDSMELDFIALALSNFLSQNRLPRESLKVLTALSASFLTARVLQSAGGNESRSAIEPLWRGAEAAADSARIISNQYNCAVSESANQTGVPANGEGCKVAMEWYERAAKAWALMFEIAQRKDLNDADKLQISFGSGLAALYWGEDPVFRRIARASIDPNQIVKELDRAASTDRKNNPLRYWAGLVMLYCLEKNSSQVDAYRTLLSRSALDKKFQAINDKAATCATSSNLDDLFSNQVISKVAVTR